MSLDLVDTVATIVAVLISALALTGVLRRDARQRDELHTRQLQSIALELNTISVTIGPYAKDIAEVRENQQSNTVNIAALQGEVAGILKDVSRIDLEVAALRERVSR